MPPRDTLPLDHFAQLYARRPDPWGYATSAYEASKYAATLAALPHPRYRAALDIGCSIGVLTAGLAGRCDALLAVEPVEEALAQARERNAVHPHVRFARLFVPAQWPDGRFDLVVISEVLDYLGEADLARLATCLLGALEPGADLLLVHWVGKKGPVSSGDESPDRLARFAGEALALQHASRNADYRLDLFRRR